MRSVLYSIIVVLLFSQCHNLSSKRDPFSEIIIPDSSITVTRLAKDTAKVFMVTSPGHDFKPQIIPPAPDLRIWMLREKNNNR